MKLIKLLLDLVENLREPWQPCRSVVSQYAYFRQNPLQLIALLLKPCPYLHTQSNWWAITLSKEASYNSWFYYSKQTFHNRNAYLETTNWATRLAYSHKSKCCVTYWKHITEPSCYLWGFNPSVASTAQSNLTSRTKGVHSAKTRWLYWLGE